MAWLRASLAVTMLDLAVLNLAVVRGGVKIRASPPHMRAVRRLSLLSAIQATKQHLDWGGTATGASGLASSDQLEIYRCRQGRVATRPESRARAILWELDGSAKVLLRAAQNRVRRYIDKAIDNAHQG